jgi:dienelactone hydrolase
MRRLALLSLLCLAAAPAFAAMRVEPVDWEIDGARYAGFLVYDDASPAQRPGLVMVPNWRGVNDAAVDKARAIAGGDYVVLVADLYGAEVRPRDNAEAGRAAAPLRQDRPEMRRRMRRAVEALAAQAGRAPLDPARIGAFGYCFGGTAVLELARDGADLAGVASLHGGLGTPLPAQPGAVKASVLVLNGADDRAVGDQDILAFQEEMDAAGADWQFVNFSGAVHCFAEPDAGDDPGSNCRYHERSARRAHRMLHDFFRERFAR